MPRIGRRSRFGVGAGAIAQVVVEVGRLLRTRAAAEGRAWLTGTTFAGVGLGIGVMYVTALLVQV